MVQIGGWSQAIITAIVVIFLVVSKYRNSDSLMGTAVAIPSRDHLPDGTLPGPYNSNPPAGGAHYATDFTSRFYQESDLATIPKYPQGYLVHSLEHGYVIFWYNCQVPNTDCASLKQTIQKVMDETGGTKLIAFPWSDSKVPLTMTSWGRILEFQNPDPVVMKQFVLRNRNQAPEPNAQ
jgi:hypothetical protein